MELFRTDDFYIFVKNELSLWWDRHTGSFIPKPWQPVDAEDPVCLGICHGIVGKIYHPSVFDTYLLVIKDCVPVGKLHGNNEVYKIKAIEFLKLGVEDSPVSLACCCKHKATSLSTNPLVHMQQGVSLSKTLKNAGNVIRNTTQQAAAIATGAPLNRDMRDKEKLKRQIIEEFHKIFTDTNSFFFSYTCDVTSSLQRLCNLEKTETNLNALWKTVDDRFFWNKHMLKSLIDLNNPLCDPWILPIIQGYIQIEDCKVKLDQDVRFTRGSAKCEIFKVCILSRRSRFRAGTRYKKRGVDERGECANYVETEQIIQYHNHEVSFVQVRGSVPVYWSQPGYKYRPPPRIDKSEDETQAAFANHFNKEIKHYGPVCIVNLTDQNGKEKIIWDAYSHHIFQYNCPYITYVTFDFHEYCRGMHFENVSVLINSITDVIKNMNYCWRDKQGHICSQVGVFRVNCIDCLDRTNVVQTAIGNAVMEIQFCKLGLITPDGVIPNNIKHILQLLWANNGDIISKQYAGTNALKGDYTRTGERKFSGIMKDGMNSANRYYLSRFKDSVTQAMIDLMLGYYVSEDEFYLTKGQQYDEDDSVAIAEHVKVVIQDCKRMLINDPLLVLGCWGLINADPSMGDLNETEMDTILILTKDSYYIADYDDQVDKVTSYQRVLLSDITLLESGILESAMSLFNTNRNNYCIRINYKINKDTGYYHMFRSTNLRFFNNVAVLIRNEEEISESLKSICEAFVVAFEVCNVSPISYNQSRKLHKRKSKVVSDDSKNRNFYLDVDFPQLTRNISESQLMALKKVGSKALTNMSQQFSKLNKFSSSFKQNKTGNHKTTKFTLGKSKQNETSSESEDEYENCIFQPSVSVKDGTVLHDQSNSDSSLDKNDLFGKQDMQIAEYTKIPSTNATNRKISETFLASVGIVMGAPNEAQNSKIADDVLQTKENMISSENSSYVNDLQILSMMRNASIESMSAPEIQINSEECDNLDMKKPPHDSLKLDRKLSHSTSEVDSGNQLQSEVSTEPTTAYIECRFEKRSNSEQDVMLNISQSQSESALINKLNHITSPITSITRDLVWTPFSKIAKGVQNLGANLDPRKMATSVVRQESDRENEENRKLQEKWIHCKTKLIAL